MRIRIEFSKTGALRYIGHLDLQTIWERAARRADLPLSYSQGFHPQPKINLASALPLGFSSRCELVDLRLNEEIELKSLPGRLQATMPSGIGILSVKRIEESEPALQTQIVSTTYEATIIQSVDPAELKTRIDKVMQAASLPRQRRGKDYDLRPLIEGLSLTPTTLPKTGEGQEIRVCMQLAAREGATGRPEELLAELGIDYENARIERTSLLFRE